MGNKIALDIEDFDAPETIEWYCKICETLANFTRHLVHNYLMHYTCNNCFDTINPINFILAGKINENKWNYHDLIWPTVLGKDKKWKKSTSVQKS